MYLNLLDDDEKRAFAELAEKMIEADGLVIGREAAALAALKAEMGMSDAGDGGGAWYWLRGADSAVLVHQVATAG